MRMIGTVTAAAAAVMMVGACSESTAPEIDWESWPYGAVVAPAGVTLAGAVDVETDPGYALVSVTASNPTATSARITYNDCAFGVRLYRGTATTEDPVYHNAGPVRTTCATITRQLDVAAGDAESIPVSELRVSAIRSELGAGTYTVVVTHRNAATGPVLEVPAGTLTIP